MQGSSWQVQHCTTQGCRWPDMKTYQDKKTCYEFKRKYKADLKRRWRKDVEYELIDLELTQNAHTD